MAFEDLESSASDTSSDSEMRTLQQSERSSRRPFVAALVGVAMLVCVVGILGTSAGDRLHAVNVGAKVGLQQMTTDYATVEVTSDEIASDPLLSRAQTPQAVAQTASASVPAPAPEEYKWVEPGPTPPPTAAAIALPSVATIAPVPTPQASSSQAAIDKAAEAEKLRQESVAKASPLLPKANTTDHNPCANDEEFHAGLCYDKCSSLTKEKYTFRQSAWTCCSKPACDVHDFHGVSDLLPGNNFGCCRHNMGFCSGFDIAGMREGKKICPHQPGACLVDEELFLGTCYKKCAELTQNIYPHRVASATCCKVADGTCMFQDGANDGFDGKALTKKSFNVGGGCGDGSALTNCQPHGPQATLTEA